MMNAARFFVSGFLIALILLAVADLVPEFYSAVTGSIITLCPIDINCKSRFGSDSDELGVYELAADNEPDLVADCLTSRGWTGRGLVGSRIFAPRREIEYCVASEPNIARPLDDRLVIDDQTGIPYRSV